MLDSTGTRELIVLHGLGMRLSATYHPPADCSSDSAASTKQLDRPGVIFINSLSLPRAASGDSAVHWADSIAAHGYPAIRVDLPGLGDSEGQASTDLLDKINAGAFAQMATAAAEQCVERYGLTGVIFFGHCAGSVSALYAGANGSGCLGLILLDPYFHLPQAKRPRMREDLSDWARRSRIGSLLSNSYDRVRNLRHFLRGSALPGNANIGLLARWKQVAAAGTPILLLKAPGIKTQGSKPRVGEFDYIDHALKLAGRKSRVAVEFVEAADHSFANYAGRKAVERHIADWMAAQFPIAHAGLSANHAALAQAGEHQTEPKRSQSAPSDLGCALESR